MILALVVAFGVGWAAVLGAQWLRRRRHVEPPLAWLYALGRVTRGPTPDAVRGPPK